MSSAHQILRPLAIAALALISSAPSAAAQQPSRHTLSGNDVAVYNLAGTMEVVAGSGSDVVVEVTPQGAEAGRLRVATGRVRGRETVRVVFPDEDILFPAMGRWSRTRLSVRADGTWGGEGARARQITISGDRGIDARAALKVLVPSGRKVSVYLAAGEATVTNVDGDITVDVHSANVTTQGTRGRLFLDTGSGRVNVADASGDVNLDSGSGGVRVRDVTGSLLRIDSGSGSVEASGIAADVLDIDSGSGSVRLAAVRSRDIRLDSGSGSVDIALLARIERMIIDSGSGRITIRVPDDFGAEIEAETGSGGIDMGIPVEVRRWSRDRLSGIIGDGRGQIRIDSGSGAVRLIRG